ncbi:MAG: hypothetical protein WAU82_07270 [Candidatus Binatus sp.]|uniref:hypothetical protein n=1 Tax=Candidatus Binatus sp. TaxID=2811406 RepID=UPI003BAEB75F
MKRFVNLLLIDLLPVLYARYDLFDLVALLPKGRVILVAVARFALRRLRSLLQIGDRLHIGLGDWITSRNSNGACQNRRRQSES